MFLESMILHNFRCFSDIEIKFNNRLTVVVGNNGAGKSTILEAATIAAGTLTAAMDDSQIMGSRRVMLIINIMIWEVPLMFSRNFRLRLQHQVKWMERI